MFSLRVVLVLAICCFLQVSWGKGLSGDDCENLSVFGGHNVFIQNAPYIAAIFENNNMTCTGSIIHEYFILTAASCASDVKKRVLVGSARLHLGKRFFEVKREICRTDYDKESNANDICVFKLRSKLNFGVRVRPIVLPSHRDNSLHRPHAVELFLMNVTGWGSVDIDGKKFPDRLQQVTVPRISRNCCSKEYGYSISKKICAGSNGHGACERDQGAPLTYGNILVGVYSGSPTGCGHGPGIYTNVKEYVTWIENVIKYA